MTTDTVERPTVDGWVERARVVGRSVLALHADELDREPRYAKESVGAIFGAGFARILIPVEDGGTGDGLFVACRILDELSRHCSSTPLVLTSTWTISLSLLLSGRTDLRQAWLPSLADGSTRACFAVTEEGAGNDIRAIESTLRPSGNGFVLSGSKWYAGSAAAAAMFLVLAGVDDGRGQREPAIALVERDAGGVSVLPPIDKLGLRGTLHSPVEFGDTPVAADAVIARGDDALHILLRILDVARPLTAAVCLGIARAALADAVEYARGRQTFGRPIATRQLVQAMLAESAVDIEAGSALTYAAARRIDAGWDEFLRPSGVSIESVQASAAKLYTSQMVGRVTTKALQVHGARGYTKGTRVERLFRDARAAEIFEGTSEIQKLIIGRSLVSGPYFPEAPDR